MEIDSLFHDNAYEIKCYLQAFHLLKVASIPCGLLVNCQSLQSCRWPWSITATPLAPGVVWGSSEPEERRSGASRDSPHSSRAAAETTFCCCPSKEPLFLTLWILRLSPQESQTVQSGFLPTPPFSFI